MNVIDSIITTLAYFDIFDYPLTLAELRRYLWQGEPVTLGELAKLVDVLPNVVQQSGLICFKDRTEIIATREQRYQESQRKFRKRLPYIRLLSFLPGVRAIFIVNTLAYQNVKASSDIDLLIITQPNKIWSTRWFTTSVAALLHLRPTPEHTKDTLCLSFYLTANHLSLESIRNTIGDVYLAYWLAQAYPAYDPANFAEKLLQANLWQQTFLPNTARQQAHPYRVIRENWLHKFTHAIGKLVLFESLWKKLQLRLMPAQLTHDPTGSVVLSNTMLKLHTQNVRDEIEGKWRERIKRYKNN